MRKGQYPTSGQGASIQFNSNFCMVPDSTKVALRHHGRVTITSALSRKRLIDAMEATCSSVMKIVGIPSKPRDWPFFIGTTDKTHQLIDNIFIYAYCIEQAKRFIRKEVPFEDLILQKNLLSDGIQPGNYSFSQS
jgi:hypothetical protein